MHMSSKCALTLYGFISVISSIAVSAPCLANIGEQAVASCLSGIQDLMHDVDTFWFGTMFETLCPAGRVNIECPSGLGGNNEAILTRMFNLTTFYSKNVDRFLNIEYTSPAGRYTGCGSTFREPRTVFSIDPLSEDVYQPWYTRNIPDMTWQVSSGELYTLLIYDAGFGESHAVYVNIEGNNLTMAEAIKPYSGPINHLPYANPYVFMVFRQQGRITIDEAWKNKLNNQDGGYRPGEFATAFSLYSPIAVNVLRVVMDAYSAQYMVDSHILNNCPRLITQAADRQNRSLIPDTTFLTVSMTVEYNSPGITFTSCCRTYNKLAGTYRLNPMFDASMASWVGRTSVLPSISLFRREMFPTAITFTDTLYTMVMLDSDLGPFLHWLMVDIADGVIETGQAVVSYLGPEPVGREQHKYYFLLYQQTEPMDTSRLATYAGSDCPDVIANRCEFDLLEFVADNRLTLAGASWMTVGNDEYTRFLDLNRSTMGADVCSGVHGYNNPCPDCSSSKLREDQCLSAIGETVTDVGAFWFGTDYHQRCWNGAIDDVDCWNPFPDAVDSLATRLFPDGSFNSSLLMTPLDVTYTTKPGYYPGCGYNELQTDIEIFQVNPLSSDNSYQAWKTFRPPTYDWHSQAGRLNCLIVYDAGRRKIVALYVNAESAELFREAKVIKGYSTLTNAIPLKNPYVFLLFLQNREIDNAEQIRLQSMTFDYDLSETQRLLDLTGPVGLNWILISMDLYSVGEAFQNKVFNNCPLFLNEAAEKQNRSFLPVDTKYEVWLEVEFNTPFYRYSVCCNSVTLQPTTTKLNPFGNVSFPTSYVRTGIVPDVTWVEKGKFPKSGDLPRNKMYTLLSVDPDVPYATAGTVDKPLLHWQVVNINRLTSHQEEVQTYSGPAPPDDKPHSYYFLLYEQRGDIESKNFVDYSGNCSGRLKGKCLYDVASFVADYHLKLVGVTWMVSSHDDYVKFQHIERGMDEADVCKDIAHYHPNCNASDDATIITAGFSLVIGLLFALVPCTI